VPAVAMSEAMVESYMYSIGGINTTAKLDDGYAISTQFL
jgi:hypothetical protein